MEVRDWNVSVEEAQKRRLLVEKHGLRIHSVMRGWTTFHEPDQEKWEASIETMRVALRSAAAYGANTVLFAPYELKPLTWPNPWEMDIDFDPKTLQIKAIVPGDNTPYAESISRQNRATERAVQAIETLIPDAAREGVILAIENVRDNFWCTPKFFAAVIRSFNSHWLKAYYDFANHQKVARCEYWLDALGSEIVKVHVKEFNLKETKGPLGGGPVGGPGRIGGGSIDWRSVRKKLDEIRYCGWLTVEEDERSLEEYSKILRAISIGDPVPNT
jgi:sugar phosphate isomerase/epimerase